MVSGVNPAGLPLSCGVLAKCQDFHATISIVEEVQAKVDTGLTGRGKIDNM
jgi:hypothetical protein